MQHIVLETDQAAPAYNDPGPLLPLAEHERRYLVRVLAHTHGVIHGSKGAAHLLQIKPTTLRSHMQKHGLLSKGARRCSRS